jgi:hypothetical protein
MRYSTINPPNLAESFKEYKDQAEADAAWVPNDPATTRVDPILKVLDFDSRMDGSNDAIAFDLNSVGITPSDNAWTLRFKIQWTSLISDLSGPEVGFGLSSANETVTAFQPQDYLGFVYLHANTVKQWNVTFADNAAIPMGGGAFPGDPILETLEADTTYYFEIRRAGNILTVTKYLDEDYSIIDTRSQVVDLPAITGLRYLKTINRPQALSGGTGIGTLRDIQFWNDQSPRVPINNVPNFEDNFETGNGWVTDDAGKLNVNTIDKVIDYINLASTSYEVVLYYDLLQDISETFWTMRCKVTITDASPGNTNAYHLLFGISNNILNSGQGQDFIGARYTSSTGASGKDIFASFTNNVDPRSVAFAMGAIIETGNTHYVEIRRLTNTTAEVNVYSDAGYSQLVLTSGIITIAAGITGLHFLKVMLRSQGAPTGQYEGTIEDLKVWSDKGASKNQDWRENNG